jgi:hypothetical protein
LICETARICNDGGSLAGNEIMSDNIERGYIDARIDAQSEALGEVLGDFVRELDDKITAVRDAPPPLIAPPDRKLALALALQRVGEEMHAQREAIEALRGDVTERAERTDIALARHELGAQITQLEERAATIEKNTQSVISMIASTCTAIRRLHGLVVRVADATGNGDVLNLVDREHLPREQEDDQEDDNVISLLDLRRA